MDMKSFLWQWLVFSFICFYYGRSDGKPILSSIIERVGQGIQRAVRSFRNAAPVSNANASTNIPINDENPASSKKESDTELKQLSDDELMEQLRKMANSDSEAAMEAKETLNDIENSRSSGKSLSQAINSAVKKVNSSRKQLKCGAGGLGFLSVFFMWFQQMFNLRSLMARKEQAVGDSMTSHTGTDVRNAGWLGLFPLARWFRMRYGRQPGSINESETTQIVRPTTRIVEHYLVDENGNPTHRIISGLPIDSKVVTDRLPIDSKVITEKLPTIQTPVVPVPVNPLPTVVSEKIIPQVVKDGVTQPPVTSSVILPPVTTGSIDRATVPPTNTGSLETVRPASPLSPTPVTTGLQTLLPPNPTPVTTGFQTLLPPNPTTVSTIRDVVSSPKPPEITTHTQHVEIPQPPSFPGGSFFSTSETTVPPNPPPSILREHVTFLQPPRFLSQIRSLPSPDSPPTPTQPGQISSIISEVNQPPTESRQTETVPPWVTSRPVPTPTLPQLTQPFRAEIVDSTDVRPTGSTQQPVPDSRQYSDSLRLIPGAIFQRGRETPQSVYFDPLQNAIVPMARQPPANRD